MPHQVRQLAEPGQEQPDQPLPQMLEPHPGQREMPGPATRGIKITDASASS